MRARAFNPDRRTVAWWHRDVGRLGKSTEALRDDVVDGQRDAADEVALTAALEGVVGYGPTPFAPRSAVSRTLEAMPGARKIATRRRHSVGVGVGVGVGACVKERAQRSTALQRAARRDGRMGGIGAVMFVGALACVLLALNPDRRTVAWWHRDVGRLVVDGQRDAADEVALAAALEASSDDGARPSRRVRPCAARSRRCRARAKSRRGVGIASASASASALASGARAAIDGAAACCATRRPRGGVMFVGAFACVLLALHPDRRTVAWNRYVAWLWESTQSAARRRRRRAARRGRRGRARGRAGGRRRMTAHALRAAIGRGPHAEGDAGRAQARRGVGGGAGAGAGAGVEPTHASRSARSDRRALQRAARRDGRMGGIGAVMFIGALACVLARSTPTAAPSRGGTATSAASARALRRCATTSSTGSATRPTRSRSRPRSRRRRMTAARPSRRVRPCAARSRRCRARANRDAGNGRVTNVLPAAP